MASMATVDQDTLLTATWASFYAQVAAGNTQLVLPDNLPSTIIATIQTRYSNLISGPVSAMADPDLQIIRFAPYSGITSATQSPMIGSPEQAPSPKRASPKSKAKIPRPANAFILYRQYHHPLVKAQFPGIVNNDISKRVATLWKEENEEVKALWKAKADEAKQHHLKLHPDYSYQPRKPSEKKRRVTKRKIAMMQNDNGQAVTTSINNNYQQRPFPCFSLDPMNPMVKEYTPINHPEAIEKFVQAIDYHNNAQVLVQYPNELTTIHGAPETPVNIGHVPLEQVQQIFEQQHAAIGAENASGVDDFFSGPVSEDQDFDEAEFYRLLTEECNKYSEQDRQVEIGENVFDFDVFGSEPFESFNF